MEELDLTIDKSGATRPKNGSFKNAALLIQNLPELKNMLAYNQLTQKVVITRPSPWMHIIRPDAQFIHDDFRSQPWDDHDTIQLKGLLERYPLHQVSPTWGTGFTIATPTLIEAIQYVADQNPFHPVRRLLRDAQSKWDGTPRLDTWIPDYLLAENTPLNQGISRLLIMAIIMRQFNPGHKYDHMVVWEGEQGIGKSQIGRILALHPEWFSDSAFDMSKADKVLEAIEGKLVVEMAELDQLGKFAITTVKSFLTQQYDRARRAWARTVSDNGRQTVFVGTTNESQYLIDVVNRRFLPVLIPNTRLRLDELKRDILQIYGEAMYQFDEIVTAQENAKQPLSEYKMELPEHLHLAAKTEQASRVVLDHRTGMLKEFLDDPKAARSATMYIDPTTNAITALTARDVAVGMMMLAPSKIDRRVQMDISTMFKQIGWKHKQVTDKKGSRHWFYIRPEHPAPFATESESVSPFENKA
jgi:predicted P-loop ATPase